MLFVIVLVVDGDDDDGYDIGGGEDFRDFIIVIFFGRLSVGWRWEKSLLLSEEEPASTTLPSFGNFASSMDVVVVVVVVVVVAIVDILDSIIMSFRSNDALG